MTKTKTDPTEALVIDCSESPATSKAKTAVHEGIAAAVKANDVDEIKSCLRELEQLLESEGPRESRVPLTDAELDQHSADQAASQKNGLLAQITQGIAATDRHVIEAVEHGKPTPKAVTQYRAKLRELETSIAQAETHEQLAAIQIPEPPAS